MGQSEKIILKNKDSWYEKLRDVDLYDRESQIRYNLWNVKYSVGGGMERFSYKAPLARSMVTATCRTSTRTVPSATSTSIGGTMTGMTTTVSWPFATFNFLLGLFLRSFDFKLTFPSSKHLTDLCEAF